MAVQVLDPLEFEQQQGDFLFLGNGIKIFESGARFDGYRYQNPPDNPLALAKAQLEYHTEKAKRCAEGFASLKLALTTRTHIFNWDYGSFGQPPADYRDGVACLRHLRMLYIEHQGIADKLSAEIAKDQKVAQESEAELMLKRIIAMNEKTVRERCALIDSMQLTEEPTK